MPILTAVRHAQSLSNAGLASPGGVANIPLTEHGHAQAREVAPKLPHPVDYVVASKYVRTQYTAQPYLDLRDRSLFISPHIHEFTYLDSVKFDGSTPEERREDVIKFWKTDNPYQRCSHDSESVADLFIRIANFLNWVRKSGHRHVLAFSHGQFIDAMNYTLTHGDSSFAVNTLMMERYMKRCAKALHEISIRVPNTSIHTFNL